MDTMYNNNMGMNNGMMNTMGGYGYGMMPNQFMMMPQANGLNFGVQKDSPKCNLTQEEIAFAKQETGNGIIFTKKDQIISKFNFRDPKTGALTLDIIDPETMLVRDKITGKEFHIIDCSAEYIKELCSIISDAVNTAKINSADEDQNALNEFNTAAGLLLDNLPGVYNRSIQKVNSTVSQIANGSVNSVGYMGAPNNMMYNGMVGFNPAYSVSLNGGSMQPMMPQTNGYYQQMPQQQMGFYNQQMTQPMGGTVMNGGNNPFFMASPHQSTNQQMPQQPMMPQQMMAPNNIAGQMNIGNSMIQPTYQPQPAPQQQVPQLNVPAPGSANPAIGAAAPQNGNSSAVASTTAKATI